MNMLAAFANLLFTAPDWVLKVTKESSANPFWADFVVWPLLQIIVVLLLVLTVAAYLLYLERKFSPTIQSRLGTVDAGSRGLLRPAADGLKFLLKADILPAEADKAGFTGAPIITVVSVLVVLVLVPWGPLWGTIANVNIGLFFMFAVLSLGVLGFVLAGWSSNSESALLGGLQSAAHIVIFQIGMALSIAGALMFSRTLSMNGIVQAQLADHSWYVFFQPLGFFVYIISALGVIDRVPFSLPQEDSEAGGYDSEYSGGGLALFFTAEYVAMIVTASIGVTLFLGGWSLFGLEQRLPEGIQPIAGILIFSLKVVALIYALMRLRRAFPRHQYEHAMELGWKWLIPAAMVNLVLTAVWYVLALPSATGGVFGFLKYETDRYNIEWPRAGLYFLGTGFLLTIPLAGLVLATINRKAQGLSLRTQLQTLLGRDRSKDSSEHDAE